MRMAAKALDGNNHAAIRTALRAVYALQVQTMAQRQRKAARSPGVAYCCECGAAIPVRRRSQIGRPMYCRDTARCKVRAYRRRKAQASERGRGRPLVTASQILSVPAEPASEPDPASLWLAMRGR